MKAIDVWLTTSWRGLAATGLIVAAVSAVAVAGVLCRPGTVTWIGMLVATALSGLYGAVLGVRFAFTDR
ncbi:hypothetical protein ACQP2U_42545 (plasmid) [Nocardia sp. CA-084685]|uniref:hypothetical protein n=1 Tax=Nocardia sp. CA-084685 TaxID=3239970 RepID=UPI003D99EFCC